MNVNYFDTLKPISLFNEFETVIFGGAVRDVLLKNSLSSDIDIVVDISEKTLNNLLFSTFDNIIKNKHNGYRFMFQECSYDIWPLESTFAYKNNFIKHKTIKNLIYTTFFSWDSILYNCNKKKIITIPNYLYSIQNRQMIINHIGGYQQTIKALYGLHKYRKYIDGDKFITCYYSHETKNFSIKLFKETCELFYCDKHYLNIDIHDIQNILLII